MCWTLPSRIHGLRSSSKHDTIVRLLNFWTWSNTDLVESSSVRSKELEAQDSTRLLSFPS